MKRLMIYGSIMLIIAVALGIIFQSNVPDSSSHSINDQNYTCMVLRNSTSVSLAGRCSGQLPQYVASLNKGVLQMAIADTTQSVSNSISISLWMMPTNVGAARINPIDKKYWAEFAITVELDGTLSSYQGPNSNNTAYCSRAWDGPKVQNGAWQNIVLTRSGNGTSNGTISMYYNGNAISASQCYPGNAPVSSAAPIMVGYGYTGSGMEGLMSNIQIYNESLTANDVQTLYVEGIGGAPVLPASLIGWWPLNGNVKDYSGNGNDGVSIGLEYSGQWQSNYSIG
jgi:hypothetical protein